MRNHFFGKNFGAGGDANFGRRNLGRLCFLLAIAIISSCKTTQFIPDGEAILIKNKTSIQGIRHIPDRYSVEDEANALIKQRPEKPFFGFVPYYRSWIYLRRGCAEGKSIGKFRKWVCNNIAQPPVLFSKELADRSEQNLRNYIHSRGYFEAKVSHEVKISGKKARVFFKIEPGKVYKIESLTVVCPDSSIDVLLKKYQHQTALQPGQPLDIKLFDREKSRITQFLRNNGHALFLPNYLEFEADTSALKSKVVMTVLPFSQKKPDHPTLSIGKITVQSDFNPRRPIVLDTVINGVRFLSNSPKLEVKPGVLLNAIALREGELYREKNLQKTNQRLGNLGAFRFVAVKPQRDTAHPDKIDIGVSLTRSKRLAVSPDLTANYSNYNGTTLTNSWLLGLAGSGTVRSRNLFKGAEQGTLTGEYSIEFDPKKGAGQSRNLIQTQDFRLQTEVVVPRFVDYFGLWKGISRLPDEDDKILRRALPKFMNALRTDAQLRLTASYDYREQFQYYTIQTFGASAGYDLRMGQTRQFGIRHLGVDALVPNTKPDFDSILQNRLFLKKSFGKYLLTGFLFREFAFNYSKKAQFGGKQKALHLRTEVSGAEIGGTTSLLKTFGWMRKNFQPQVGDLDFAQFVKIDWDANFTQPLPKKASFVGRFAGGISKSFNESAEVPFVKQQFIGGPYSLRGWPIRKIGPGGYNDPVNTDPDNTYPFYQSGDLRLETTAEFRFPLWWIWEGALFADAGNIWTLEKDPQRPLAGLTDFYKEIALNTGFGIRGDFSYFIIRLDWGLPLRNNYADPKNSNQYWIYGKNGRNLKRSDLNWNVAIGYPFQ